MSGIIKKEDIEAVRQRINIAEVISPYVTLSRAGVGSQKGLCPFHDERSASFNVRPQFGTYYCFGCGKSGDVYQFLQEIEHLTFVESVEKLAAQISYPLSYEEGTSSSGKKRTDPSSRQRLLDAHKIADEFYQQQLLEVQAQPARAFLQEKCFSRTDIASFGVGYAPRGWGHLYQHLSSQGFTDQELTATGLFSSGRQGLYDRFRGRVMWPIRDISGATIGFGARKIYDDDAGPKYLNTPETEIYKKSQVLYGLDLARKHISQEKNIVIVEGYTDVMAAHLAGVKTAVATCGTAFGTSHAQLARRILADDPSGQVIFTFDGDAAGQSAALKAFEQDQKFLAQTYVAVEPHGCDPNDLRIKDGNQAVRDLISFKKPLVDFALRAEIEKYDVSSAEGRIAAIRAGAPIVADIKDRALRTSYTRDLSLRAGVSLEEAEAAVKFAQTIKKQNFVSSRRQDSKNKPPSFQADSSSQDTQVSPRSYYRRPDLRDRRTQLEKTLLEALVQFPHILEGTENRERFEFIRFKNPAYVETARALQSSAQFVDMRGIDSKFWIEAIKENIDPVLRPLIDELTMAVVPVKVDESSINLAFKYGTDVINTLYSAEITAQKDEKIRQLRLLNLDGPADQEELEALSQSLKDLEIQRRQLDIS